MRPYGDPRRWDIKIKDGIGKEEYTESHKSKYTNES
jgi:hypothetical protein